MGVAQVCGLGCLLQNKCDHIQRKKGRQVSRAMQQQKLVEGAAKGGRRGGREKTDQAAAVPVCVCGNKQQAAGQKAIVQFARRNEATIERTETKQRRNTSGTA